MHSLLRLRDSAGVFSLSLVCGIPNIPVKNINDAYQQQGSSVSGFGLLTAEHSIKFVLDINNLPMRAATTYAQNNQRGNIQYRLSKPHARTIVE
jgi:hypothetical protein